MKENIIKKKLIVIYEFLYEKIILRIKYRFRILNSCKTIRYIKKHKCSISRYGDGEFGIMLDRLDIGFQDRSEELRNQLINVFRCDNSKLLICIPHCLRTYIGFNDISKKYWKTWNNLNRKTIYNLIYSNIGKKNLFGDSLISRPYMDKKSKKKVAKIFKLLRSMWDNRSILIVEGRHTCMGVGNDLFDNALSIKRILAPAKNAFKNIDEIRQVILSSYNNELIIIALGPTATVLASDLSNKGIQALDLGHIDIEYEWYIKNATEKTIVPGKYVNEVVNGQTS